MQSATSENKLLYARLTAHIGGNRRPGQPAAFTLDVDLRLPGQGVTAISGASGSGKTSLLRCIAGLQAVSAGELVLNGERWHHAGASLPTHHRPLGYVFQEASLFEHLTAEGNLRYAQRRAHGRELAFSQVVSLLELSGLLNRYPRQLSGGERQRVAIGRALLINPRLLLMDEPLAALDRRSRQQILAVLEQLQQQLKLPILYVAHRMEEVVRLADYLVILEQGRVAAQGELSELLSRTDLSLGAEAEAGAVLQGIVGQQDQRWQLVTVKFGDGELQLADTEGLGEAGTRVRLRVLARDVSLALDTRDRSSILNRLPAAVVRIDQGSGAAMCMVQLRIGDSLLLARVSTRAVSELGLQVGQQVFAQIKSVAILR